MGCEAVSEIETTPNSVEAITGGSEPRPSPERAYRKPSLQHLGAWNIFTRQISPSTVDGGDSGFFELDFGR